MNQIISAVEKALEGKNWYGALFIALTIPDICGCAQGAVEGVGNRYKKWFDDYLKKKYAPDNMYELLLFFSPDDVRDASLGMIEEWKKQPVPGVFTAKDCYDLRNACLHQGVDEIRIKNFKISTPDGQVYAHQGIVNGVMYLEVTAFCNDILDAARAWIEDYRADPIISSKIDKMIKIESIILI